MMPNLEIQVNKTQAGLYTVTYGIKEAPLDVQEATFAGNGLEIVSPAQLGFLRAKEGKGAFSPYSRTSADVFYDHRDNHVVIFPDGQLSKLLQIINSDNSHVTNLVDAHRQGKEYVIPQNQRDLVYAMVDEMLKSGIAFIARDGHTTVKTSEFGKNDLTSRLFSDKSLRIEAQEYGDWLQSQKRGTNDFFMDGKDYSRAQRGPYLNKLRVYGSGGDFVVGNDWFLYGNDGAFGVRFEKTAEGGAKK